MTSSDFINLVGQSLPDRVTSVVAAVSGGLDSVVLLDVLQQLSLRRTLSLQVVHLNHLIRPEGERDARFVEDLCRRLDIPCRSERCDVPALAAADKISLEMAGRQARRSLLTAAATEVGAPLIALGHHRNDQVETFLMRLVRGTGLSGLVGMEILDAPWWRPLLHVSRRQLREYAAGRNLQWCEDATNLDPSFVRNRLRTDVVPRLEAINPGFDLRLEDLREQIRSEEDYWRRLIDLEFPRLMVSRGAGLTLDRGVLLAHHPALRLRLIREVIRRIRGDLQGIAAVHLQALDTLVAGRRSQAQIDLPGCWAAVRYDRIELRACQPPSAGSFQLPLPIPGDTLLPDGRVLRVGLAAVPRGESCSCVEFAVNDLPGPLYLRSRQPGDRFAPAGMTGHKRLKNFLIDLKISKEERDRVPLVFAGEVLLWVVGLRRSRHAVAGVDGGTVVRLELLSGDGKADKSRTNCLVRPDSL